MADAIPPKTWGEFFDPHCGGGGKWRPFRFRSPSWMTSFPGSGNEVIQDGGRKRKGRHFPPPPQWGSKNSPYTTYLAIHRFNKTGVINGFQTSLILRSTLSSYRRVTLPSPCALVCSFSKRSALLHLRMKLYLFGGNYILLNQINQSASWTNISQKNGE